MHVIFYKYHSFEKWKILYHLDKNDAEKWIEERRVKLHKAFVTYVEIPE